MQVSVETTSGLERRLTVGIPAVEVDSAVESKLKDTAKRVRIDGFRPGKVPFKEVKRRFGKSVRAEVVGEVISAKFYEAISGQEFTPAGQPRIENVKDEPGQDIEFTAVFEVYPEIEVTGLTDIKVNRPVVELTESDVDSLIEKLREQRATYNDVDREARDGDQVVIDYTGKVNGEEFEGGSATDSNLVLGSNSMIPGFESGIEGAKAGETRDVTVTFPEDYHQDTLKGQEAVFTITVHKVQEKELPELNEAFIEQFAPADNSIDGFRQEVRKNMERELKSAVKNSVKKQVLDGLLEQNPVDVPGALVEAEIERQRQQFMQQFGGAQIDPSMLPANLFEEQATRMVKLGLLLGEVIKQKELKADGTKVRAAIEEIAEPYEDPQEVVNWYYENQGQLRQVESLVLEDTAIEAIMMDAEVVDTESSYEETVTAARGQ